jgi:hypothetical protein
LPLAGGIERVFKRPISGKQALLRLFQHFGFQDVFSINAFDQIEEKQKGKLFGIGNRIRITATKQIIAYLVNRAAHVGG